MDSLLSSERLASLRELPLKVAQLKLQYSGFAVFTATRIIEQEIIDEIHSKMESANISKKIIQTTFLNKKVMSVGAKSKKSLLFYVTSNYVSDSGFPVAIMIERGRKEYDVYPVKKKMLSWLKDGIRHAALHVHIPVYPARRIIENTIRDKRPVVQQKLDEATVQWMKSILKG